MEKDKLLFEEIFRQNKDRVYRLCCLYSGDEDLRKDLMQDIFIKVWENLNTFRGEAAMSTWIYRIALNTCLTHVRSIKNNLKTESLKDKFDIAEFETDKREELNINFLIHSVNKLPALDRTIISLYLEDISGQEIAEITGLSEVNVRVRIHRIKEQLNEMIKELSLNTTGYEY